MCRMYSVTDRLSTTAGELDGYVCIHLLLHCIWFLLVDPYYQDSRYWCLPVVWYHCLDCGVHGGQYCGAVWYQPSLQPSQ